MKWRWENFKKKSKEKENVGNEWNDGWIDRKLGKIIKLWNKGDI